MQQSGRGIDVGLIGWRRMHVVHQAQRIIGAALHHAELPALVFARLVHLGLACARSVLGRDGGSDDRGVHNCTWAQHQALPGQVLVDGGRQRFA